MFFKGDDFTVNMTVKEDLTGSTIKVRFRKPNSKTIIDKDPTSVNLQTKTISYDYSALDNDVVGDITMWTKITNANNKTANSKKVNITILGV